VEKMKKGNAVYVWTKANIFDDSKVVEICKQFDISNLFLSAYNTRKTPEAKKEFSEFNMLCSANGLDTYAMASTNEFALNHKIALEYIDDIVAFNDSVDENQRFKGVHFDIEPYCLPQYREEKTTTDETERKKLRVLKSYLEMTIQCYEKTKQEGLDFGLSIPYWFKLGNRIEISFDLGEGMKPLSYHIIDNSDHIAIMAYRNEPGLVVEAVSDEIVYAEDVNMETGGFHFSDNPQKKVFVAVENLSMMPKITEFMDLYKDFSSYAGIAIHPYRMLKDVVKNRGNVK
jgi:hypothetical protein